MIQKICMFICMICCLSLSLLGQNTKDQSEANASTGKPEKAVIIPRETVMSVVVFQPDCPLKLEFSTHIAYFEGDGTVQFRFRNQGKKWIKKYRIAWLFTGGGGGAIGGSEIITPGQSIGDDDNAPVPFNAALVPLTPEVRKSLKLGKGLMGIVYYMIVHLEYDDGTVFDDAPAYKVLQEHLEKTTPQEN